MTKTPLSGSPPDTRQAPMTHGQAEQLLDRFLSRVITSIGFRRAGGLEYELPKEEAFGLLLFPCRLSPRGVAFLHRTCRSAV